MDNRVKEKIEMYRRILAITITFTLLQLIKEIILSSLN